MYSRCARRVSSGSLYRARPGYLPHRRLLATEQIPSGSGLTTADVLHNSNREEFDSTSRSVVIHADGGVRTMPAALAIIHEVEKRFGKVREFKLVQDKDMPTEYMPFFFVNFANIDSIHLIRDHRDTPLSFTVVPWDTAGSIDGGIALEDIKDYLRPAPLEDDASLSDTVSKVEDVLNVKRLDEVAEEPTSLVESLHESLEEHYNEDASLSKPVGIVEDDLGASEADVLSKSSTSLLDLPESASPEKHSHDDLSLSDTQEPLETAVNGGMRLENEVASQSVSVEATTSAEEPLEEQFQAIPEEQLYPSIGDQSVSFSEEATQSSINPGTEESRSTISNLKKEVVCRFSIPEHSLVINRKLAKDFFQPQFVRDGKPNMPKEKRIRVARAFIEWGGFYPSYNFLNESTDAQGQVTSDLDVEALLHEGDEHVAVNVADATPSDPKEAHEHAVFVATRAMRSSLIRQRSRLRDLGQSDHGLVQREGRMVVAEWLAENVPKKQEPESGNSAQVPEEGVNRLEDQRPGKARDTSLNVMKKMSTKVEEKPKALSKEEKKSWERLVSRMIPGSMSPTESAAANPIYTTSIKRPQKKDPARTSSPSDSASQIPSSQSKNVTAQPPPVSKDESRRTSQAAASLRSESESSSQNESANNRARRQARKIAEEQRQQQEDFKSKLLGWVRSGLQ